MRNSSARRDEPPRRHEEPSLRRGEPQRRYEEPSRHRDEPQRRHLDEPSHYGQRDGILYDSGSRAQKRRLPDSTASAAPTRRVGVPSSQELGRAPPAPKGAVDGRVLSGQISKAGSTHELLRLAATHSASLNHIHVANLWNKLGKQRDASGPSHREEMRRLLRRTVELLDSCNARALSNIAHGLAKCALCLLYTSPSPRDP